MVKENDLISVVVPNYNNSNFIGMALDSILLQEGNFKTEIIVVDDASTDKSVDVIRTYQEQYNNIVLIINNSNMGLSYSRNIGMKNANGKYIVFLDADDFLATDTFKNCIALFKKYKTDIVSFDMMAFFPNGDKFPCYGRGVFNKEQVLDTKKDYIPWMLSNTAPNMFKTEKLKGIKFKEGKIFEDWMFNYSLFSRGVKIKLYNDKPLYYYRRGFTNTITSGSLQKLSELFDSYNIAAKTILKEKCYNIASVVNDTKILTEALGILKHKRDKNYNNIKLFIEKLEEFFEPLPETYKRYLLSYIPVQDRHYMKLSTGAKIAAVRMFFYTRLWNYKNKAKRFLLELYAPIKILLKNIVHIILMIYKLLVVLISVIVLLIKYGFFYFYILLKKRG